jgi:PPOX class probable F420-dependent enzyme
VTAIERAARLADRLFDRARHRSAFELGERHAADGDLRVLTGSKYVLLVTYRRDGTPVPSPVWCAIDDGGRAFVKTAADVGKVKRIRHDSRVLLAPCTARGKPMGPAIRGSARLVPPEVWLHAEQTLAAAYGAGRRASEAMLSATGEAAYLEIAPRNG